MKIRTLSEPRFIDDLEDLTRLPWRPADPAESTRLIAAKPLRFRADEREKERHPAVAGETAALKGIMISGRARFQH
jgi:hypothetical protein